MDLLKAEYNISKFAGSVKELKHTLVYIKKIRDKKSRVPRTKKHILNIASGNVKAMPVTVTKIKTGQVTMFSSIISAVIFVGINHSYVAKCVKNEGVYKGKNYIIFFF